MSPIGWQFVYYCNSFVDTGKSVAINPIKQKEASIIYKTGAKITKAHFVSSELLTANSVGYRQLLQIGFKTFDGWIRIRDFKFD